MDEIVTIDGTGRLVVPKAIRTRLHLREGARLRVREEGGTRLVLEVVSEDAVPVEVDGLLVLRGRLVGDIPDHREQRTQRIRSLGRTLPK
jgi:AbrB family looped-hinge helix DNA binding protein